jgi:hydrogenase maturation protein HypF
MAAKFHNAATEFLFAAAVKTRELTALNVVALSGGCFANRLLTARLTERLEEASFEVLQHRTIPCNDGCVALGQAVVAAAAAVASSRKSR